jgi:hypothetical protein
MINQADQMLNEKQVTVGGKLKKFAVKTFVKKDKVKQRVPIFAQSIVDEIKKPVNKEKLKFLVQDKLSQFAAQTHDNLATHSLYASILSKYNTKDLNAFNATVPVIIQALQDKILFYSYMLVSCMVLFLLLWLILHKQKVVHTPLFILSVILAFMVLTVGLSTPMIEIDARIKEFNFTLVGKQMVFHDQVLFFQSKSILDVVHILLTTQKADSVLVGVLILIFSVLFPLAKLISTKLYLLGDKKRRSSKILRFFAFHSGKWSMADVMVVAIFMSYIGFKGIIDSQMSALNMQKDTMTAIATNETSLQPGFILFVSYVIFGLILGVILRKITSYAPIREEDTLLLPSPVMKDLKSIPQGHA